jgi:hypothetical protein
MGRFVNAEGYHFIRECAIVTSSAEALTRASSSAQPDRIAGMEGGGPNMGQNARDYRLFGCSVGVCRGLGLVNAGGPVRDFSCF